MYRIPSLFNAMLASFSLSAAEPQLPSSPDEAPEVTAARASQLARSMGSSSIARGFRIRVVDQFDRPLAGIPVITDTTNMKSTYAGQGSPYVIVKVNYLSDAAGEVTIPSAKLYGFNASVDRRKIPSTLAILNDDQTAFSFSATDAQPPAADAQRLGVDAVLRLYRYLGPKPLFAVHAPVLKNLHADGTAFPWSPLQRKPWTALPVTDFELVVTRDPTAPFVIRGRLLPEEPEENLPNFSAGWSLHVRCLRGGIAPVTEQEIAFLAPEGGYRTANEWNFSAKNEPNHYQTVRFFWRRTGQPVRYGFIELNCRLSIKDFNTNPKVSAAIESWAYINPAADGRILERSFQERYDPSSEDTPPWITALSPDLVEQWNLEPIDGGAIPLDP